VIDVSVILPTINEAENLPTLLPRIAIRAASAKCAKCEKNDG